MEEEGENKLKMAEDRRHDHVAPEESKEERAERKAVARNVAEEKAVTCDIHLSRNTSMKKKDSAQAVLATRVTILVLAAINQRVW